ncbi:MAG TPA: SRPBCC family protein [Candidatus Bathyarchaeia archaeon]|nr:SRPBCC family protein [Candidatus Bathyarchaeia archaeon]
MKNKITTIRQKVVVPASLEEIYEAFMDPKKHAAFTGSKATGDPRVGGKFTAWDGYIYGENLELLRGKRIAQKWKSTDFSPSDSFSKLELSLKKVKEGTEISMVHSDVPAGLVEDVAQGWKDFYWRPLKAYFKKASIQP